MMAEPLPAGGVMEDPGTNQGADETFGNRVLGKEGGHHDAQAVDTGACGVEVGVGVEGFVTTGILLAKTG